MTYPTDKPYPMPSQSGRFTLDNSQSLLIVHVKKRATVITADGLDDLLYILCLKLRALQYWIFIFP
jgi:hypothetical protein